MESETLQRDLLAQVIDLTGKSTPEATLSSNEFFFFKRRPFKEELHQTSHIAVLLVCQPVDITLLPQQKGPWMS